MNHFNQSLTLTTLNNTVKFLKSQNITTQLIALLICCNTFLNTSVPYDQYIVRQSNTIDAQRCDIDRQRTNTIGELTFRAEVSFLCTPLEYSGYCIDDDLIISAIFEILLKTLQKFLEFGNAF